MPDIDRLRDGSDAIRLDVSEEEKLALAGVMPNEECGGLVEDGSTAVAEGHHAHGDVVTDSSVAAVGMEAGAYSLM